MDQSIDKLEFMQYMLVHMGKVSQEDVDKVVRMFEALDEDGSGKLDAEDILEGQRRQAGRAVHSNRLWGG